MRALLSEFAEIAGAKGRVIFTFMEKAGDGSINFRDQRRIVSTWLSWRSEPFRWGARRSDLDELLRASGLADFEVADDTQLRQQFLVPLGLGDLPIARGECLCYCKPKTS